MNTKGYAVAFVLVMLAVLSGAVGYINEKVAGSNAEERAGIGFFSGLTSKNSVEDGKSERDLLSQITKDLKKAEKSGGIHPDYYNDIDNKLKGLEARGANTRAARAILSKLDVGGSKSIQTKNSGESETIRDIEKRLTEMLSFAGISPDVHSEYDRKLKALEAKGINTSKARAMWKKLTVGGQEGRETPAHSSLPSYANIERQLNEALKSGGIRKDAYDEMERQIKQLESKGTDVKTLLTLLSKIPKGWVVVHEGKGTLVYIERNLDKALQSDASEGLYRELDEELKKFEEKGVDVSALRAKFKKLRIGGSLSRPDCVSNPNPVFTNHITDIGKVVYVFTPPNIVSGDLKTHSYIGTNSARVPVYAPVDMIADSGAHFIGGPYGFEFEVSCEVRLRFGHITEPVPALKAALPSTPAPLNQSQGQRIKEEIRFKAGDLVAYTTGTLAGNWDFGVYNLSTKNKYANDSKRNHSWVYTSAVCPFDYFTSSLRAEYAKFFDVEEFGNLKSDGEFCSK